MNKLFNIDAQNRDVVFYLETFDKNRTVNKIIKSLKLKGIFKVKNIETQSGGKIYSLTINSSFEEDEIKTLLKITICDIIRESFPLNYQFDFKDRRLGFSYNFNIFRKTDIILECYTRVKEMRKDGSSILPEPKNQIRI